MYLLVREKYNPRVLQWLRQVILSPAGLDLTALVGVNVCGLSKMQESTQENQGFTKIVSSVGYLSIAPVLVLRTTDYCAALAEAAKGSDSDEDVDETSTE